MCIFTKQRVPKVADKPIRCLKVVRRVYYGYVPYYFGGIVYNVGKTYYEPMFRTHGRKFSNEVDYNVFGKGFHSFTINNPNARKLFENAENAVVLECEIPEGSRYFEGYSNTLCSVYNKCFKSQKSFLSERIKIIRVLTFEEVQKLGENG